MLTTDSYSLTIENTEAHWLPFSSNRYFKESGVQSRVMVSAQGAYYTTAQGKKIFDAFSGLWCTGLGHGRADIAEAVGKQALALDYAPAFQWAHPLGFALANKVKELMPKGKGLDHVFFTNSGSEAADTAMKMARAYWRAKGQATKTRFIGRERGYHGVNFGGMSIGGIGGNRKMFGSAVEADHLPHTALEANSFSRGQPEKHGVELANRLLDIIALHDASNIAAVFVEPFAGSAGVLVPPKGYLERLREICTANDILLVFDEVITGFGRCGAYTGAEAFGVTPDILNVAKQITNGVQPLGAVVAKKEIYDTIMQAGGPHSYTVEFAHGYTYSAHPVACAAGIAALDLLIGEDLVTRVRAMAPYFENLVHSLKGSRHVLDIRNYGLACGITLAANPGENGRRPFEVANLCQEKGFYVRYAGDTVCLAPTFISERHELDSLVNALGDSLRQVT